MLNIFYQTIFTPLGVFNRKNIAGRLRVAIITVLTTTILGSIIAPILYYYVKRTNYDIHLDIGGILIMSTISIITWLTVCLFFWFLSKVYKKDLSFRQIVSTWGLSYVPNFLCVVLYNFLLIYPGISINNGFVAFIVSSLFIMFLVWKAIFYFMLMRFVIDTSLREITIFTGISIVVFSTLMMIGFKVGLQVPML